MVVFAHGLEGHPEGKKPTALRDAGLEVLSPDGRGQVLAQRIGAIEEAVLAHPGCVLVGSSYGGLAALYIATRRPTHLRGLVLCAPALVWGEPPVPDPTLLVVPATLPCEILHGTHDTVVPLSVSQALAVRSGPRVALHVLDDDHRLANSLDLLVAAVKRLGG